MPFMRFRHWTNLYFCDILISEGKRNPRKTNDMKEVIKMKELLNKYLEMLNKAEKMRAACVAAEFDRAKEEWETKIDFYSSFIYDIAEQMNNIVSYELVTETYYGYVLNFYKTIVF